MRRRSTSFLFALAIAIPSVLAIQASGAGAGTFEPPGPCRFRQTSSRMYLLGDCTTTSTIRVPNGKTFDGQGFTIWADDPQGGQFVGAVVANAGAKASVINTKIDMTNMADICVTRAREQRLAGIMLFNAGGKIADNSVVGPNMGPDSACAEGSAIRILADPLDGTHKNFFVVEVVGNIVSEFQLYGIVTSGNARTSVKLNLIGVETRVNTRPTGIGYVYGGYGKATSNYLINTGLPDGGSRFAALAAAPNRPAAIARAGSAAIAAPMAMNTDEMPPGNSLGLLAVDSQGGAQFTQNWVLGTTVGALSTSTCFRGGTNASVNFDSNAILTSFWGIGVEAGVSSSLCNPLNYKTKVRGNALLGMGEAGSIGVIAMTGNPDEGKTPLVTHTEIIDNDVSDYATCIVDLATKTKLSGNVEDCPGGGDPNLAQRVEAQRAVAIPAA